MTDRHDLRALFPEPTPAIVLDRREWAGAWYGETWVDGRYVVSFPDGRVETSEGLRKYAVPILTPRLGPHGRFCGAAGGGVLNDHAIEWDGTAFQDRGYPACGTSPCAYDPTDGRLVISHCEPPFGSQGIRWIDPVEICPESGSRIWTGDATYTHPTVKLYEWTQHGDVLVGQGGDGPEGDDPCLIVVGGTRYLLESGTCRFIRFDRDGDRLAIAFFKMSAPSHVRYLLTVDQIFGLPRYGERPPVIPPILPPEDLMKPPIVTVTNWTLSDVLDGREFRFKDDGNPELAIDVRVWVQGGSMYAALTNKAGSAQTGMRREVEPCSTHVDPPDPGPGPGPGPEPEPEPEPEPGTRFHLKTAHGGYLCVGPDAFLTQTGTPAVCEEVPQPNGTTGLKADGYFVASETDLRLKADRATCSDWEYFHVVDAEDGRVYQAWQGSYISAHADGSVAADRPDAGPWETFQQTPVAARPPVLGRIQANTARTFFGPDGQAWRWRGVSAFPLCRQFIDGTNIQPFLSSFPGYTVLRVWDYVPWTGTGWNSCTVAQWQAFLQHVGAQGWYVELTLLTDDDPGRIPYARTLVDGLAGCANLLVEIGNEPEIHKTINTQALRDACERSGLLYSSGNYETSAKWFGRFGTAHTPRDSEWPRKGHDLMEYYDGGGPSAPTDPACKAPWVGDEPIRPHQCDPNWYPVDRSVEKDFQSYGGVCALLGAGCTFHFDGGRFGVLPTDLERACAAAMRQGLEAFPPDAPNWAYRRIDEQGRSLRTYVKGDRCMVRVRPTTSTPPEAGWTPLDAWGQLFVRTGRRIP